MPRTKKPCPGCGSTHGRDVDKLCARCDRDLKQYREREKRLAEREHSSLYRVPKGLPYYRVGKFPQQDLISTAMTALLDALAPEGAEPPPWGDSTLCPFLISRGPDIIGGGREVCYHLPAHIAQTLDQLDSAIMTSLKQARIDGRQEGSSLLDRLASGEVTVGQFNDLTQRDR
ncbi:MAG: hypothetical protein J2P36_25775 [Ktedonobacteraceae bacterium]|nr:hypothetical protein [Ktedonobacteraceae bacterium]